MNTQYKAPRTRVATGPVVDPATIPPEPIDGFTLSMSVLQLPTSYAASAQAQMEVLRQARGYQFKAYSVPTEVYAQPVAAFGQLEQQISMDAGSYIWGYSLSIVGESTMAPQSRLMFIQLTDSCTETAFFCDYVRAIMARTKGSVRAPFLLPNPHLISDPGQVNVEIYNSNPASQLVQLVLFTAQPYPPRRPDLGVPGNLSVHRTNWPLTNP